MLPENWSSGSGLPAKVADFDQLNNVGQLDEFRSSGRPKRSRQHPQFFRRQRLWQYGQFPSARGLRQLLGQITEAADNRRNSGGPQSEQSRPDQSRQQGGAEHTSIEIILVQRSHPIASVDKTVDSPLKAVRLFLLIKESCME